MEPTRATARIEMPDGKLDGLNVLIDPADGSRAMALDYIALSQQDSGVLIFAPSRVVPPSVAGSAAVTVIDHASLRSSDHHVTARHEAVRILTEAARTSDLVIIDCGETICLGDDDLVESTNAAIARAIERGVRVLVAERAPDVVRRYVETADHTLVGETSVVYSVRKA